MKKKLNLSTLLSMVHLVFVLSIFCFAASYLTLSILALPALTSAFRTGRDVLYREYDVYDSVVKTFFRNMKAEMRMMKYFPLQLFIILQAAGMYAVNRVGMQILLVPMLICTAVLLTVIVYIITYHVFVTELPQITEVVIVMFYRIQYLTIIWMLMLLVTMFFGMKLMIFFLFVGALALFAVEAVAFLGIMSFRKLKGDLTEEEKERIGEEILNKL